MITPSFSLTATERVLPKLALDFTTASLDSRVTFTRTTDATHPATYINNIGVVSLATNDQPRFDYNPVTKVCNGLLIEESRSNLILQSQDFSTTWTNGASSETTDVAVSPDGTQNADKIIESNTTAWHYVTQGGIAVTIQAYTFSVFAKAAERSVLQIIPDGGAFPVAYANYNLSAGTVSASSGTTSTSITDFGNGWYRCTLTISATSASTPASFGYFSIQSSPTAARAASYAGNGTSGLYLWGAQLEAGAFATSYIPTTTTALTRNADVATMTGTNFSDWFNATEGSFYVSSNSLAVSASPVVYGRPLCANDTTQNNSLELLYTPTGSNFQGYASSSYQGAPGVSGTYLANTVYEQVGGYVANNVNIGVNGVAGTADTTFTIPAVTQLRIGAGRATASLHNGHIQKIMYWPQRLTNAELAAFSK